MPREITEEEYAYLQSRKVTADFMENIYNDPALNKETKALIKKKYPNLSIPDYDLEQKIDKKFQDRDAKFVAQYQKRQDEAWKKKRADTQKQYGFTDEGMTDLEKFMVEKGIGDYDVAATYKVAKNPKSVEPSLEGHMWNHHKRDEFKAIAADPEGWGQKELMGAIYRDMERAKNPNPR